MVRETCGLPRSPRRQVTGSTFEVFLLPHLAVYEDECEHVHCWRLKPAAHMLGKSPATEVDTGPGLFYYFYYGEIQDYTKTERSIQVLRYLSLSTEGQSYFPSDPFSTDDLMNPNIASFDIILSISPLCTPVKEMEK